MTEKRKHPKVICRICKKELPWQERFDPNLDSDLVIEITCDDCFQKAWDFARKIR